MTNIKTPEEIAKEIVCNGIFYNGFQRVQIEPHLVRLIKEAISAERNANLEKIKELEERIFSICEKNNNLDIKNDDLESKLADYENRIIPSWKTEENDWIETDKKQRAQITKLEAEAKAVRSKTIEECADLIRDHHFYDSSTCWAEQAIRALNSGKE